MAKEVQSAVSPAATKLSAKPDFDLSSFEMDGSTLEIRYPRAFAMWDRSGQLCNAFQEKWPDMVPVSVDPQKIDFHVPGRKIRLSVAFERAHIIGVDPAQPMERFFEESKEFIQLTTSHLGITTYKRVGFRLRSFKEYKDKSSAAAAFFSLGLIRVPDGKKFEVDEQPVNPHYALRWESEKKGTQLQCRSETRTINIDVPPEGLRGMKPIHKEMSGIVFDVDYYTVAPVDVGQMDTSEWMKHAMHVITRDSRYVFGE
jgi:hypothetical protein